MGFARMMAAAALTAAAGAGGLYAATPDGPEQGRRVVVEREGGDGAQDRGSRVVVRRIQDGPGFDVFHLGGGSRVGMVVRDVEAADVAKEKLAGQSGAVVTEVIEDSAAGKAGVKSGDVVTSFDGERVRSARQLERLVSETPAGRTVKMALHRGGTAMTVDVTPEAPKVTQFFGPGGEEGFRWQQRRGGEPGVRVEPFRFEMPAGRLDLEREGFPFVAASRGRLGVRVQDLSDELAGYFGVKAGVLVSGVEDEAPAAKAGVKAGDVITAVNGEVVADPAELRREVAKVEEGKAAELSITRDRKSMTLNVEVTARDRAVERRMRRSL